MSPNQNFLLDYLIDLNDEYDERDYSRYGAAAEAVEAADIAFIEKVGAALKADRPPWN